MYQRKHKKKYQEKLEKKQKAKELEKKNTLKKIESFLKKTGKRTQNTKKKHADHHSRDHHDPDYKGLET